MQDGLEASKAPVIFSHSSAYAICNNTRNVPDDILQMVAQNGGIVMVNFFSSYLTCGITSTVQDVAGIKLKSNYFNVNFNLIHYTFIIIK